MSTIAGVFELTCSATDKIHFPNYNLSFGEWTERVYGCERQVRAFYKWWSI